MAGAFKNECAICGKQFKAGDKAVALATVHVVPGKGGHIYHRGTITSAKVGIHFRSNTRRKLYHLSCAERLEREAYEWW